MNLNTQAVQALLQQTQAVKDEVVSIGKSTLRGLLHDYIVYANGVTELDQQRVDFISAMATQNAMMHATDLLRSMKNHEFADEANIDDVLEIAAKSFEETANQIQFVGKA